MNAPNRQLAFVNSDFAGNPARPLAGKRLLIYSWQMAADMVAILAAFALAAWIWMGDFARPQSMLAAQMLFGLYVILALYNGAYSLRSLTDWGFAERRMITALLVAAAMVNLVAFYLKTNAAFSRVTFTLGLTFALAAMSASRLLALRMTQRLCGPSPVNVVVIDDGGPPVGIAHARHVDAREAGLAPRLDDPHGLDRLGRHIANADQAIVSCAPERRREWALALKGSGIEGHIVDEFVQDCGALGVRRYDDAGLTALMVSTGPLGMRDRVTKRVFDIVAAGLGLLALAPVLLLVALAIRLEDGGPVIFAQNRFGRGNRLFRMFKFRTMRVEASDAEGFRSTEPGDERVTRVGRILRKTSLDELPQLFNVLRGDMSMVGPRPHALGSQAGDKPFWLVDRRYWQRHSLKPGLTGLAQVRGWRGATRSEADLSGRLQADLEYLSGWSLWRDLRIILSTLRVVVHDRAY